MPTVVGCSTGTISDSAAWQPSTSVALPAGTSTGDLILAGYYVASTSDARLAPEPTMYPRSSAGVASSLGSVTFDGGFTSSDRWPGLLFVAALTDLDDLVVGSLSSGVQSTVDLDDFVVAPGDVAGAVAWVWDFAGSTVGSSDLGVGDASGWSTEAHLSWGSLVADAKCFSYVGGSPAPDLVCSFGPSYTATRYWALATLVAPASPPTRSYLRQRQVPRLRQRRMPSPLRQRQFIP